MPGFAFLFFFLLCSSSSPLLTETISTSLLYVVGREGAGAAVRTLLTRVEGEAGWRTAAGRAARQLKLPRKASAALARRPPGRRGGRAHSSHVAGCPTPPGGKMNRQGATRCPVSGPMRLPPPRCCGQLCPDPGSPRRTACPPEPSVRPPAAIFPGRLRPPSSFGPQGARGRQYVMHICHLLVNMG